MFREDKQKKLSALILACVLLIIFISSVSAARSAFLTVLELPFSILNTVRRQFKAVIFYYPDFCRIESLEKENDFLRGKVNALTELRLENERLQGLLSLKEREPFKVIASRLIARSADNWSRTVVIDRGRSSGIKRGMAVINYAGFVGRVIEAEKYTAKILLISDPGLGVSAQGQRSRQEGLVCGTLGRNLIMRYLPEKADIKAGDVIVTSGLNSAYPKGLLLGTVTEIGREFSSLSRYAAIEPAVDFSALEEVLVVVQPAPSGGQ